MEQSPIGMLRMKEWRKGKSSTLDKPTSPGGFPVWTTCYMTTASPLAKLLLGMHKSVQSRRTFLFHRGHIKSVSGERSTSINGQKKWSGKNYSPFLINRIHFPYAWNKSAYFTDKRGFFISYLQAGWSFEPNLKHEVNPFLHPQQASLAAHTAAAGAVMELQHSWMWRTWLHFKVHLQLLNKNSICTCLMERSLRNRHVCLQHTF